MCSKLHPSGLTREEFVQAAASRAQVYVDKGYDYRGHPIMSAGAYIGAARRDARDRYARGERY